MINTIPVAIKPKPIGVVRSPISNRDIMPPSGEMAKILVFPEYARALKRIEEYSHLWVLAWLHQAEREVLTAVPSKVNPTVPSFGVFALRSPSRPNPIALSLVPLIKREGDCLEVKGLDVIDGTPVLDIKPYFEHDTVFSPCSPYIPARKKETMTQALWGQALNHHGEECTDLKLAVRMGLFIEERLGYLKNPELKLKVIGSPCLADCLQGLTRARLANPPRFAYQEDPEVKKVIWTKGQEIIFMTVVPKLHSKEIMTLADEELFTVQKRISIVR